MSRLFNYKIVFDNNKEGDQQKIIYVLIQAPSYFEAEEEAEKYRDCLYPHYSYWGIEFTHRTLDNPPYLDDNEYLISVDQLKELPEYKELN
jgi:hypothetical protein